MPMTIPELLMLSMKATALVMKHEPHRLTQIMRADDPEQMATAIGVPPEVAIADSLDYLRGKYAASG